MMKNIIVVICLLFYVLNINAQDSIYLNLQSIIAFAKSENFSARKAQLYHQLADANHQKAKEWWVPNMLLGTNIHHLDGSALNTDGRIFDEINRQSRWYGTEVNLNWDLGNALFLPKAKKLEAQSSKQLAVVAKNQSVINTIELYYELLRLSVAKSVYEDLISSKESLIDQLSIHIDNGMRRESELLLSKSNKARVSLQLITLEQEYQRAMTSLMIALNIRGEHVIHLDLTDVKRIDLTDVSTPTEGHPALDAIKLKNEADKLNTKAITLGLLPPKLGLRYSFGKFGENYESSLPTDAVDVFIGWEIPLSHLIYGGDMKITKSRVAISNLELEETKMILNVRVMEYQSILSEYQKMIDISQEATDFSRIALEQARKRQEAGISNIFELLLAEEEYTLARIAYVDSVTNYNKTHFKLLDALGIQL